MKSLTWNISPDVSAAPNAVPEEIRPPSPTSIDLPAQRIRVVPEDKDSASIGAGLLFKGRITGTSSLYIDGEIDGNIDLPESRVIVGPGGRVSDGLSVCINARQIVIMGKVRGNVTASDMVEIQASGALTGNVTAQRICIADGAFFKGDIELHTRQPKRVVPVLLEEEVQEVYA